MSNNGIVEPVHWLKSFMFMRKQYKPIAATSGFKYYDMEGANTWCFHRIVDHGPLAPFYGPQQDHPQVSCLNIQMPYSYKVGKESVTPRMMTPHLDLPSSTPYNCLISMNNEDGYQCIEKSGF